MAVIVDNGVEKVERDSVGETKTAFSGEVSFFFRITVIYILAVTSDELGPPTINLVKPA